MNIKDNIIMLIGITLISILALMISSTLQPANAETLVLKNANIFKYQFEGHDYISTGGNYFIHSESCPCKKGK